jgi:hypothetical protein
MFAQFRASYPTGQLISELLTVHNGKFVVRCLIQVDNKTLATGISAAESVEEAEDRARWRSLAVLGFDSSQPVEESVSSPRTAAVPTPVSVVPAPLPALEIPSAPEKIAPSHQSNFVNTQSKLTEEPIAAIPDPAPGSGLLPTVDRVETTGFGSKQLDSDAWLSSSYGEPLQEPELPTPDQTELPQGAAELRELQPLVVGIPSDSIEDSSDTIAQIDAILKRLQWKKKQESDCLEHNYGKLSQGVLSTAELIDFREYLEIYSQTTDEIKRLGWSPSQGKDYLKQGYGKEARHFLNKEELLDFLQYLESLP